MKKKDVKTGKIYGMRGSEYQSWIPIAFVGPLTQLWYTPAQYIRAAERPNQFAHSHDSARPHRSGMYGPTGYLIARLAAGSPDDEQSLATLTQASAEEALSLVDSTIAGQLQYEVLVALGQVGGLYADLLEEERLADERRKAAEQEAVIHRERRLAAIQAMSDQAERICAELDDLGITASSVVKGAILLQADVAEELVRRLREALPGYSCVEA